MEKQNNLEIESPDENKIKNKFVFVNTENIAYSFGEIVEELKLNSNDTIILMQSKNSKRISIQSMEKLISCGAKIEFETVEIDINNSMDIQMSISAAAALINEKVKHPEYEYYMHAYKIDTISLLKYIIDKIKIN